MKKLWMLALVGVLGFGMNGYTAAMMVDEGEGEVEAVETVTVKGVVEVVKGDVLALRLRVNKTDAINLVLDDNSRPLVKLAGQLVVVTGTKAENGVLVQKFEIPPANAAPDAATNGVAPRQIRMNVRVEAE